MLSNFRTYQLSKDLYRECEKISLPGHLRSQLSRASMSITLNIAEGYGRMTHKDQRSFFTIAYGSTKEVQAILELGQAQGQAAELADHVAACLYKLTRRAAPERCR